MPAELLEWLNTYTFVEEQKFAERAHADAHRVGCSSTS